MMGRRMITAMVGAIAVAVALVVVGLIGERTRDRTTVPSGVTVRAAAAHDVSPRIDAAPSSPTEIRPLGATPKNALAPVEDDEAPEHESHAVVSHDVPPGAASVEQTSNGTGPAPRVVASFDGLGVGFEGPQGIGPELRNPSDNTLAVGPDHIVQIVNTRV